MYNNRAREQMNGRWMKTENKLVNIDES